MGSGDDLLSPEEIEQLMQAARASQPAPAAPVSAAPKSSDLLDASEIEALMSQAGPAPSAGSRPSPMSSRSPEQTLDSAARNLAAAMGPASLSRHVSKFDNGAQMASFEEFSPSDSLATVPAAIQALQDVELDVRVELGRAELLVEEVLKLREGSVVPLDKLAGDPVDIVVNGRLVARGEVLVLNDNFCVRVAEILAPAA